VAGKESRTRFQVLQRFTREGQPFSLVRCYPRRAVSTRFASTCTWRAFPWWGTRCTGPDPSYFDRFSRHCLEPEAWERLRLPRHALHAAHIAFSHPGTSAPVTFDSPLPADLEDFIAGRPVSVSPGSTADAA
jgi:23S rRNA pseudouridine1911/1915/1917 synthase